MDFLPLFFQLHGKSCLVVGGGAVALRKATLLSRAGAVVSITAHEVSGEVRDIAEKSGGQVRLGEYRQGDLKDVFLVIAATDDGDLNQRVSQDAHAAHVPVNVVDSPELCSFILPAIIDRSPLVVAVSSGGKSPVLARLLRSKIEYTIPAAYGELAKLVGDFRDKVKARFSHIDDRRNFWEEVLDGPVAEMVFAGKRDVAEEMLAEHIQHVDQPKPSGEVFLVGAGPGDPDLLTFKALRLMQKADVVLYDRLVSSQILDLCRRDAEKIHVGKARSDHTIPQEGINSLLVKYAKKGKKVVRLKGGDPFIFGRGGEEIEELAQHKIPFQVVPGITAASGCACYSGIPLTHRDYAQSVRFVTGHLKDGSTNLPWEELVHGNQTVVFYMGLVGLPVICEQLIAHGRAASTPIAIVQQGTTQNHKVVIGQLCNMAEKVAAEHIHAPTLLIVGEVVDLHDKLNWFVPQSQSQPQP